MLLKGDNMRSILCHAMTILLALATAAHAAPVAGNTPAVVKPSGNQPFIAAPSTKPPQTTMSPQNTQNIVVKALPADSCRIGYSPCAFKAMVADGNNNPLPNVKVNFYIKGNLVAAEQSKADGVATGYHVLARNELPVGPNVFEAKYAGENKVLGATLAPAAGSQLSGTGTVTVVKGSCTLFLKPSQKPLPPDPTKANSLHVDGYLMLGSPGAMVGAAPVKLSFAGRSVDVTAKDGDFTLDIPLSLEDLTKYKTSSMTANYAGDDQVQACTGDKQINLQSPLPKAWGYSVYGDPTPSPSVRLGDTVRIKVHFHTADSPYAPVGNMPFTVVAYKSLDTMHLGSGVTDSQGNGTIIFQHTKPMEPGSYAMQVRYNNNGQEYVNYSDPVPGDARESVIVLPTEVNAEVTAPNTAQPFQQVTVTLRVTRAKDHVPAVMQTALEGDDGMNMIVKTTDSQGNAVFTFTMPPAATGVTHHDFTVHDSTGDKKYAGFVKKFSITYPGRL